MTITSDVWEYRSDLERLARYLCRHHQDAEDVTHNALIKAAEKIDGFRGEASVRTWLHTITTNECRMLRRKKAPSSLDDMFDQVADGEEFVPDDRPNPEEILLELETRKEVMDAISSLPERNRCALLLKEGRGLSIVEIADLMDTTGPAVKTLLYRARGQIREVLESR